VLANGAYAGGAINLASLAGKIESGDLVAAGGDLSLRIDQRNSTSQIIQLIGNFYSAGKNIQLTTLNVNSALQNLVDVMFTNASTRVSARGNLIMNHGENMAAEAGDLTLVAGNTAYLGDVAARGTLEVDAQQIVLLARGARTGQSYLSNSSSAAPDQGLNFVANSIVFNSSNITFDTTDLSLARVLFASAQGQSKVPLFSGATFYSDPGLASQFSPLAGQFYVQPVVGGIITAEVASVLAGAVRASHQYDLPEDRPLTEEQLQQLLTLGVFARDPNLNEIEAMAEQKGVFDAVVLNPSAAPSDYQVVDRRLPSDQVNHVLKMYAEIFLGTTQMPQGEIDKSSAVAQVFDSAYVQYLTENPSANSSGFGGYLNSKAGPGPAADARYQINRIRRLFDEIGKLGLTDRELNNSEEIILGNLPLQGITSPELRELIVAKTIVAQR
jgi:hypothetical protein